MTEKDITIFDLAARLNVAASTISRALNNDPSISEKRKKEVIALAKKFGYRTNDVARNLRTKKTRTVGVIVPRLNTYFMSNVLSGIEKVIRENGYSLLITESEQSFEKEASCVQSMFNNRPAGVLASLSAGTKDLKHFDPFFQKDTPVIFFDQTLSGADHCSVTFDEYRAAFDATTHLLQQGCKKIFFYESSVGGSNRLKGFQSALAEAAGHISSRIIRLPELSADAGQLEARKILASCDLPDGIFIPADSCAIGCMMELKKAGIRVPGDVAIVGFNNEPVAEVVEPGLTTLDYPGTELGKVAAEKLIKSIQQKNGTIHEKVSLTSRLVVRSSSLKSGIAS